MHGLFLFAISLLFIWLGRSILIPLLMAAFLWYLINAIADYCRRIFPYKNPTTRREKIYSKIYDFISGLFGIGAICGLIVLFITQVHPMFSELVAALPELQHKFIEFGDYLSNSLGIKFDANMLPNIAMIAKNIGTSTVGIATSVGMVAVYMFFMFVEQSTFNKKFSAMFPNKRQNKKMRYILDSIDDNMKKYLFVKTAISAITALASYLWLYLIGVEFAGVWAFLVFIANYIPTIGAIVACGLPILYALVTAPSLQLPILTAAGLIGIQILFGNILEPKLTGKTLNLSTLAILINLVFWGMLWGIAGMFFSVPLLVAVFIITAQFDSTRWVAVLLSADGNIPDKDED
ncbi:MAG: AI-2E family transporter [Alphaproteobacteria bacterium]|nr:AI-2E family transporter [Alphaproteobacteria bacterium]